MSCEKYRLNQIEYVSNADPKEAWFAVGCFIAAGIFFFCMGFSAMQTYRNNLKDLQKSNILGLAVNEHVYGETDKVLGRYTHYVSTGANYYYILPAFRETDSEYYIIAKIPKKRASEFDDAIGKKNVEPIYIDGRVEILSEEVYNQSIKWALLTGFFTSETEARNHILPYGIVTNESYMPKIEMLLGIFCLCVGIVFAGKIVADRRLNQAAE